MKNARVIRYSFLLILASCICILSCACINFNMPVALTEDSSTLPLSSSPTVETTLNSLPEETTDESVQLIQSGKYTGIPIFDLADYAEHTELCYIDENVGPIDSLEVATEKAKQVWIAYMSYDFYEGKELQVYYDPNEDCWLAILKILPREEPISPEDPWPVLDCEPCVIFQGDGQIIGLWTQ